MNISVLTTREVRAHDLLILLCGAVSKLSQQSREKVYHRWEMLHMCTPTELTTLKSLFERVNDDSGKDRREQ